MPIAVWKEMMDQHYPNTALLSLERDLFERLYAFRRREGLADWDQTIARLLPPPDETKNGRDQADSQPCTMNAALVEKVVNAVLYEGYILYPYRASSKKNRERFTFGRVYPEDYSIAQHGRRALRDADRSVWCATSRKTRVVAISVRFLHPMAREVGMLTDADRRRCPRRASRISMWCPISVGEQLYQTWQEVVEQKVEVAAFSAARGVRTVARSFDFPARARSSRFGRRRKDRCGSRSPSGCGARRGRSRGAADRRHGLQDHASAF